jgi:hypothetical protein
MAMYPWTLLAHTGAPPAAWLERQRKVGSSDDATPARWMMRRKIPLRISWRNVIPPARLGHRRAWSVVSCPRAKAAVPFVLTVS